MWYVPIDDCHVSGIWSDVFKPPPYTLYWPPYLFLPQIPDTQSSPSVLRLPCNSPNIRSTSFKALCSTVTLCLTTSLHTRRINSSPIFTWSFNTPVFPASETYCIFGGRGVILRWFASEGHTLVLEILLLLQWLMDFFMSVNVICG